VFKTAKISAFGATERPGVPPRDDANIQALVEAGPPVVTIFGNAWDFHVTSALGGGAISKIRPSTSKQSIFDIGDCGPAQCV